MPPGVEYGFKVIPFHEFPVGTYLLRVTKKCFFIASEVTIDLAMSIETDKVERPSLL